MYTYNKIAFKSYGVKKKYYIFGYVIQVAPNTYEYKI